MTRGFYLLYKKYLNTKNPFINSTELLTGFFMSTLHQNRHWLFGIFTFVMLFTGTSLMLEYKAPSQSGLANFSALTDADLDLITAVKAEMRASRQSDSNPVIQTSLEEQYQ